MESSTTNHLEIISKGRWQWQSNPDAWLKAEPPQWELYPLDHNYLIEKAYYDQKKELDLGDYLIYPLDLLQVKKGNLQAQRPVRRIDWMDDEEIHNRSARYFDSELPKTINRIFGGLGDFISFFSRRNGEILDFTNLFKELEKSNDLDILNHKITPKLVNCLEEVLLKPIEEKLNDSSITPFKKNTLMKTKGKIEELISPLRKTFSSFEEFYGQIVRAYTMNTGLYPDLNQYLRNESWMEIDKLLPYAFCLCKAFFHLKPKPSLMKVEEEEKCSSEELISKPLYRGTAFDEFALSFYDITKIQYFSWNAVTSTTTNKEKAKEFMYNSVEVKKKKDPVMFIIELPHVTEPEEYLKWLDICQYSAMPNEKEVILPPGSVFELVEVSTDQDKKTTIKIKLKNEVQSLAHRGMMMQGTLQSQMMTEKEAKIMCLEGEELYQALKSISGNKLIEELEFCLCTFDRKLLNKMFEILPKLQRAQRLKFIACMYEQSDEIVEISKEGEKCEITKIEVIEANGFFQMICNEKRDQTYWTALRELDLDFRSRRSLTDQELNSAVFQGLQYVPKLAHLNMNFQGCERITDEGIDSLAQGLSSLTQLTCLDINFRQCFEQHKLTFGEEMITLANGGLKFLSQLKSLNLDFEKVEDEWFLLVALKKLTQLTSLTLGLLKYNETKFTSFVSHGLKHLTQLKALTLDFWEIAGKKITDKGLETLAFQGLKSLTSLTELDLRFHEFIHITNKGVANLACQGLKHLIQLKSLALKFYHCYFISDEGVSSLMAQGLKTLTQLTSLTLDFNSCDGITEKGIETLAYKWLGDLPIFESLTVLGKKLLTIIDIQTQQQLKNPRRVKLARESSLKYKQPFNEERSVLLSENCNLKSESLVSQNLSAKLISILEKTDGPHSAEKELEICSEVRHLPSLAIDFRSYRIHRADQFVHNLACQVFKHCHELRSLTLHVNHLFNQITDEGVRSLALYGLKSLTVLTSLTLNFRSLFSQITEKGIIVLASEGLRHLSQLKSLNLNFVGCDQMTDEAWICLAQNGLQHLSQLESLVLCPNAKIADKAVLSIAAEGLRHLSQLKSLNLEFTDCHGITNKGWINLARNGLRHLSQLESLALRPGPKITDQGMRDFALFGLKPLADLASLSLDFFFCLEITDKGVLSLASEGLRHLSQLKSLNLSFTGSKITDKVWMDLARNGLKHLSLLESLVLCPSSITEKGVDTLVSQGLKYLTKLKSLAINFHCSQVTDKGVNSLILQIVKNLPELTSLDFNFEEGKNISDFTIQNLIRVLHYFGFTKQTN